MPRETKEKDVAKDPARGIACPICAAKDTIHAGRIFHPYPAMIAGVPVDLSGIEFSLRRCPTCRFEFKNPPIPEERLLACYAKANSGHWEEDPDPYLRRFDVIGQMLRTHAPGRRVLDVGCFNGALLQSMPSDWEKFGIEPSAQAAAMARSRGVSMLGATLDELDPDIPRFDAVTAIDLAEHIIDPVPFFRRISQLLRPGGLCVVVTGDTGALSWRMQGSRYWYCSLPEHVSFYSLPTMERIAQETGMRVTEHRRLSHDRAGLGRRAGELVKNLGYSVLVRAGGLGVGWLRHNVIDRRAPGWITARDHLFCAMIHDQGAREVTSRGG